MVNPLSPNELKVMEFIEGFVGENGFSPSFQEIKEHFGFASFNSVQRYIKQLQSKGYINIPGGNQKRAIQVLMSASAMKESLNHEFRLKQNNNAVSTPTKAPGSDGPKRELLSLPLLGKVAAGRPIEALENDEFTEVPPDMVRDAKKSFTLKVKGNSMIEDGIFDGDTLIIQEQKQARNGEICVAVVDGEATVKRLYLHQGAKLAKPMVELRPSNENMESMWYAPEKVEVRGIVVGLLRKF